LHDHVKWVEGTALGRVDELVDPDDVASEFLLNGSEVNCEIILRASSSCWRWNWTSGWTILVNNNFNWEYDDSSCFGLDSDVEDQLNFHIESNCILPRVTVPIEDCAH